MSRSHSTGDTRPSTVGQPLSEMVIVSAPDLNLSIAPGNFEHMGDSFYKCRRMVANMLSLTIISEWPIIL